MNHSDNAPPADYWRLNAVAVLFATIALLVLVGASRNLPGVYFAYSELIRGYSGGISPWAIFLRFAIPFVVGFAIIWFRGVTDREAMTAALLTSLLLAWGPIMAPEQFLSDELYAKRYLLYVVYIVFGTAFTLMCRGGALAGMWLRSSGLIPKVVREEFKRARETIRDLVIGLIGSAIYAALSQVWSSSAS